MPGHTVKSQNNAKDVTFLKKIVELNFFVILLNFELSEHHK